jgi:protein tyrosine phosphatase (PTP) superfamily phosphohydrolase (DUF442 family)
MPRRPVILMLALGCGLLAGCKCCHRRPPPADCPPAAYGGGGSTIPPQGIPVGPPPAAVPRGAAPDVGPTPGDTGTELLLPQAPPPGKSRSEYPRIVPLNPPAGATLGDPDYLERPKAIDKPVDGNPPLLDPLPTDAKPIPPTERPTGIDEFTHQVKDGVSAGHRPTLEGLDWLKAKGYKTVVHVRRPQDADETDRRQVERRDMKFVSLTVSPETLTQAWVDEFNKVIGDTSARPVFVYGQDPQTAAVTWYLHLRTAEFLTHDEARVRAMRLGLSDDKSDLFRAALKVAPPNQ